MVLYPVLFLAQSGYIFSTLGMRLNTKSVQIWNEDLFGSGSTGLGIGNNDFRSRDELLGLEVYFLAAHGGNHA
jgi:hypothetical protein